MDATVWSTIKSNVTEALGDAAGSLKDIIDGYRLSALRDVANFPYWSWYPATSIDAAIQTAISNHFSTVIEYGILAKIDSIDVRGGWQKLYANDLSLKQIEDLPQIGLYASGTNAVLTAIRDRVYKNIAAYHKWSWLEDVPITLATDTSQEYITIPVYMGKITSVYREASGVSITYMPPGEMDRLRVATVDTSTAPYLYTIKDGRLYFFRPAAAGTEFTINYSINADLLDDNVTPAIEGIASKIPSHFSQIVIDGIKAEVDTRGGYDIKFYGALNQKKTQEGWGKTIKAIPSRNSYNASFYTGA